VVEILIPKKYTKFDHVKRVESQGRKRGKPIGSHIIDLADLRKAIVLCPMCLSGFNAKKHHYIQHRTIPFVQGQCDACRNQVPRAAMFVHESINY
jgi:hypothetical protein